jgi:EpsI family protein
MNLLPNAILMAGALLISYGAIDWVKSGYRFTVAPPAFDVNGLPLDIGEWNGQEEEILDGTVQVLHAQAYVNRIYVDSIGREVSMHAAVWSNEAEVGQAAPHHPQICYPSSGWEIMDRRRGSFPINQTSFPVEWMLLQKEGKSIVIGHWYEMGDRRFTAADEGIAAFCALWGEPVWPSTVKFLVQTNAGSIKDAEPLLQDFCSKMRGSLEPTEPSTHSSITASYTQPLSVASAQ